MLFCCKRLRSEIRANWWLSAVGNSNGFCNVNNNGNANANNSSNSFGVRPIPLGLCNGEEAAQSEQEGDFNLFSLSL